MKKKRLSILSLILILAISLTACGGGNKNDADETKTIKYGKAAGPYTVLFEDAIIPIMEKKGYKFETVEFSDLLQNDTALNDGDIDVNVEQHTAYMNNFNESQGGDLVALTPIPTVPAGIFSSTKTELEKEAQGAKVAIPDDPANTARAYLLLQKAGWIKLKDGIDTTKATKNDIGENPYNIEITEMDSASIPRTLEDFDYGVIPGSVVYSSGIDSSSVLLQEDMQEHLILQLVVKEENKDKQWAKDLVEAYHSDEFKDYMEKNNKGLWYVPEEK